MPIIRIGKRAENNYYLLRNSIIEDESISWEARGILIYLLSRKDTWTTRIQDLINRSGKKENGKPLSGRDKIQRALRELQNVGYASLESEKNEDGTFAGKVWMIYEDPTDNPKNRSSVTDNRKNRLSGKPIIGKTAHITSTDYLTSSLSGENSKNRPRTKSGAIDAKQFAKSVKSESKPEEAPPVAPPPPEMDPEAVIVSKLDPGPTSQLMDVWKMHSGANYEKIAKQFQDFAAWWIDKKCVGMSDDEIDTLVKRTGSKAFRASFKKSFLPRINNKTENGTATHTKKGAGYIKPSDLARLYPEFYPAESNSRTQAANDHHPDPEQEFEIVSEPDGGIFAKHPFA